MPPVSNAQSRVVAICTGVRVWRGYRLGISVNRRAEQASVERGEITGNVRISIWLNLDWILRRGAILERCAVNGSAVPIGICEHSSLRVCVCFGVTTGAACLFLGAVFGELPVSLPGSQSPGQESVGAEPFVMRSDQNQLASSGRGGGRQQLTLPHGASGARQMNSIADHFTVQCPAPLRGLVSDQFGFAKFFSPMRSEAAMG